MFIKESSDASMNEKGFTDEQQNEIRHIVLKLVHESLSYYHAMDLFGNVPFVDESDPIGVFTPEQITRSNLFNWIETELLSIEDNLLDPSSVPYGRASKAAAQTLLAKMYLNAEVYTVLQDGLIVLHIVIK